MTGAEGVDASSTEPPRCPCSLLLKSTDIYSGRHVVPCGPVGFSGELCLSFVSHGLVCPILGSLLVVTNAQKYLWSDQVEENVAQAYVNSGSCSAWSWPVVVLSPALTVPTRHVQVQLSAPRELFFDMAPCLQPHLLPFQLLWPPRNLIPSPQCGLVTRAAQIPSCPRTRGLTVPPSFSLRPRACTAHCPSVWKQFCPLFYPAFNGLWQVP